MLEAIFEYPTGLVVLNDPENAITQGTNGLVPLLAAPCGR